MIDENTLLKLLLLDSLKTTSEASLHELSWEIGVEPGYLENIIRDLGRNYLIRLEGNKVVWNIADNPSYLKPWGWRVIHKTVLGSTQEYARGCGLWALVVAEYLLMGKGRHGKRWVGNLGGLWITYRLPTTPLTASYAPIAIPLIIIDLLNRSYGVKALIKWPNDIVYGEEKLAGILIEAEAIGSKIVLNIGIGLNVNNEPPLPGTTSLKKLIGRLIPRNGILSSITSGITKLEELVEKPESIKKKYLSGLATLNKRIKAKTIDGEIEGVAVDVNEYGDLIVEVDSGKKILEASKTFELRHLD